MNKSLSLEQQKLVEDHMDVVAKEKWLLIKKHPYAPIDEIEAEGYLALVSAALHYKEGIGTFRGYAHFRVGCAMKDYLRRFRRATGLRGRYGNVRRFSLVSIENITDPSLVGTQNARKNEEVLSRRSGNNVNEETVAHLHQAVRSLMPTPLRQRIIDLLFLGHKGSEIAMLCNCSEGYVSQAKRKMVKILKEKIGSSVAAFACILALVGCAAHNDANIDPDRVFQYGQLQLEGDRFVMTAQSLENSNEQRDLLVMDDVPSETKVCFEFTIVGKGHEERCTTIGAFRAIVNR